MRSILFTSFGQKKWIILMNILIKQVTAAKFVKQLASN